MAESIGKSNMLAVHAVNFDLILPSISVATKKQVFSELSKQVAYIIGVNEALFLNNLMEQELEGSSGVGNGISIPHMRLPRLTRPFVVFAKLAKSVDFDSIDSEPVDMVCMVLSPDHEGSKHLRRLSEITRFFRNDHVCDKLRHAEDKAEIRNILHEVKLQRFAA